MAESLGVGELQSMPSDDQRPNTGMNPTRFASLRARVMPTVRRLRLRGFSVARSNLS
jgi:hypothetical protein